MKITKKESTSPKYNEVDMREPLVADMVQAHRVSGATEGATFEAALMAQICTFDGKQLAMEDVEALSIDDFFLLKDTLFGGALTALAKQLSTSQG